MEGSLTVTASIRHVKTTQIIVHQIDVIYSRNILDNGHKLLIHKQTSGIFFALCNRNTIIIMLSNQLLELFDLGFMFAVQPMRFWPMRKDFPFIPSFSVVRCETLMEAHLSGCVVILYYGANICRKLPQTRLPSLQRTVD